MGDCLRVGKLSHYVISHPVQLSLAIPPWVGAMSTVLAMVTATVREENGTKNEFCVAVAPGTRTAGTYLVKVAGCQIEPAIRPIWITYWLNWV